LASLQTERPTDKVARARSVTAYLAIESGIPEWQIRRDLNCDRKAITAMEVGVMLELAANRFLEAEVTYLATTDQVHSSLDRRISHLVAEAFDVSPDEISRPQTPAAAQAQDMALRLLAERRHTSLKDLRVTYRLGNYELVQAVRRSIRSRHPGRVRMIRKMLLTEQADISTMARAQAEEVELETTEPEAQAGSESIVNDDIASVQ